MIVDQLIDANQKGSLSEWPDFSAQVPITQTTLSSALVNTLG
jgi:hypothetical protein